MATAVRIGGRITFTFFYPCSLIPMFEACRVRLSNGGLAWEKTSYGTKVKTRLASRSTWSTSTVLPVEDVWISGTSLLEPTLVHVANRIFPSGLTLLRPHLL
ncbi:MAG: hypothetical protein CMA08_01240, partial [Euryarchaeota archaeon]